MKIERTVYAPNLTMKMEFELTPKEIRMAYEEQQHLYDRDDIENELDCARDDYIEDYSIDKEPITEKEIDKMARELRRILDKDADISWSYARCEAVNEVLRMRNPKIVIGRPINGISINGLEYVLDGEGNELTFDTISDAKSYLEFCGISEEEIEAQGIVFEEVIGG